MTARPDDTDPLAPQALPLAGIRVAEWSRSLAGGYAGRMLCDAGARVVRVGDREASPAPGSALAAYLHGGKVAEPGGLADVATLGADIVLLDLPDAPDEAFLAGFGAAAVVVITPWGLSGPWAGAGRPSSELTIQAESGSLSLRGLPNRPPLMTGSSLSGPRRDMVGYAQTVEQFSGLCWRTGYPDADPHNPSGPADPIAAANSLFALALALLTARRTGRGTLVKSPLAEAALVMAGQQVITWTAAGVLLERRGNRDTAAAPQGVFPTAEPERWVALTVADDVQWRALADLAGRADWAGDATLATADGRRPPGAGRRAGSRTGRVDGRAAPRRARRPAARRGNPGGRGPRRPLRPRPPAPGGAWPLPARRPALGRDGPAAEPHGPGGLRRLGPPPPTAYPRRAQHRDPRPGARPRRGPPRRADQGGGHRYRPRRRRVTRAAHHPRPEGNLS
jgi:hypothetical protein